MNFKYTISPPKTAKGNHLCRCWGAGVGDGNYTGLLGDLYNEWCDVAWANLYEFPLFRGAGDLTQPYSSDRACFLVSKRTQVKYSEVKGNRLLESAPAVRAKLRREIRVPISNNYARLSVLEVNQNVAKICMLSSYPSYQKIK